MSIDLSEAMSLAIHDINDDDFVLTVLTLLRDPPFRAELAGFIDAPPQTRAFLLKAFTPGLFASANDNGSGGDGG